MQIESLITLIGTYVDKVGQVWGGQIDADTFGADEMPKSSEYSRSIVDLDKVISDFIYFFQIAKVRRNLEATSKEIDTYSNNYPEMLGRSIAQ